MDNNARSLRESRLVRIDSRDRSIGSVSPYSFTVDFNDYFLNQIQRCLLKSVFIPNTQYNVSSFKNGFTYDAGSGTQTVTVTAGQYTLTELMTALIAAFAAATPVVTLTYTYNTNTSKLTLTWAPNTLIYASSTMAELLGIGDDDLPSAASHVLPSVINMSGLQKVYIGSHTAAKGTTLTSSDKQHIKIFTEIAITVPYGSVEHRVLSELNSIDESTHSMPFNLSSCDVTLYDQDLNVLNLNGAHWQMVLKVFKDSHHL